MPFAVCGCTETAEVLTRRVHDEQNAVTPGAEAGVPPNDAGEETQPVTTAPSPATTSTPPILPGDGPDAADSPNETTEPQQELLTAPALAVGAGHNTTCVIINQSSVSILWCFGEAEIDPLQASEQDAETPRGRFVAATGGEHHMCALDTFGDVYCWGDNSNGELGSENPNYAPGPRRVRLPRPITQLSSGARHVCALTDVGQLHCWGSNVEGQLGLGGSVEDMEEARDAERREPTLVDSATWVSVAAGEAHTCGVKSDGTLSCWGRNAERQSGNRDEAQLRVPTLVNTEHSWKQAVAGSSHSCGLRTDGTLWCWGSNATQEALYPLGAESGWQLPDPTQVGDGRWRLVVTGAFHSCAVNEAGELACWGRNDAGQLGTGDAELRRAPTLVWNGAGSAAIGRSHSCLVTASLDDVLCTGSNEFGQLALPNDEQHSTFVSLRNEWQRYLDLHFDP